jgi:hypothetical protein
LNREPVNPIRYVTLAYGDAPGVYRQSLMLLLSLVAHAPEPYALVVATDRPDCYVWFGTRVEIEYLDAARLDAWRGPQPFSMRQKLELARLSARGGAEGGAIVLFDADVLALKPLNGFVERLHRGGLFMHRQEYVLSRSRRRENRKLWASLRSLSAEAAGDGGFLDTDSMWNSSVLAVPTNDRALLDSALELYDALGAAGVRHVAAEQLVEGIVLGRTGRLRPAEEWFAHYRGHQPAYDAEIARRLADAFIEGMSVKEAAEKYRESPIDLPVEVRRTRRQKLAQWIQARR